jgi:uncharacterized sporulation protein YeaH/YhbH (DUF444 family)
VFFLNQSIFSDEKYILGSTAVPESLFQEIYDTFHIQHLKREHEQALFVVMMDTSGSMGIWEYYMVRCHYFWIKMILEAIYENVEVVFISHEIEAKIIENEKEFFQGTYAGGTIASSVLREAIDVVSTEKYLDYDIYAIHGSDGDNLSSNNKRYFKLFEELASLCKFFSYVEVNQYNRRSTLLDGMKTLQIKDFPYSILKLKTDMYHSLQTIFLPLTAPQTTNLGHLSRLRKD